MIIKTVGKYRIDYQSGDIENAGYRVYKMSLQTHRNGQLIKTPIEKRRPRWKLIKTCSTEDKAIEVIDQLS